MGTGKKGNSAPPARAARLEEALRANLKRRKDQARARADDAMGPEDPLDTGPGHPPEPKGHKDGL